MCGLVALMQLDGQTLNCENGVEGCLRSGLHKIAHRGPDASGVWTSSNEDVALGHVRLSINDLSTSGDQPMSSNDNSVHIIVNGELYDYDIHRAALESKGYRFLSTSDSELVLGLYQLYGFSFTEHLRGEFAICLYDERQQVFIAVRDRYGIKPLFWRLDGRTLYFASEQKAWVGMGWKPEWDVDSIVQGGWYQDSSTLFRGSHKLLPGHMMVVRRGGLPETHRYWTPEYPDKSTRDARPIAELISGTQQSIFDAVRCRMKADVPIGIFLSGGIDSTAVAGVATHLVKTENIKMGCKDDAKLEDRIACFTIAFEGDREFDESEIAKRTAKFLGVGYHEVLINEEVLAANFAEATYHCEISSSDFAPVGKFVLSELPRTHGFKVVLTGEGADEHFGGYLQQYSDAFNGSDPYFDGDLMTDETRQQIQQGAWAALKDALCTPAVENGEFTKDTNLLRSEFGATRTSETMAWNCMVLQAPPPSFYIPHILQNRDMANRLAAAIDPSIKKAMREKWHPLHASLFLMGWVALSGYLLVALGDRVEMAHSLEARPVFLDHHLTKYVSHLPPSLKIRWFSQEADGVNTAFQSTGRMLQGKIPGSIQEKWVLREAMRPYIPEEVYKRNKQYYGAPMTFTPGGKIQSLLAAYVTPERVANLGFLDWTTIERYKNEAWDFAFRAKDSATKVEPKRGRYAIRMMMVVAGWIVIGESFGVKRWTPGD